MISIHFTIESFRLDFHLRYARTHVRPENTGETSPDKLVGIFWKHKRGGSGVVGSDEIVRVWGRVRIRAIWLRDSSAW